MRAFWTEARAAKFLSGEFVSRIHATFDWAQVAEAHAMMEVRSAHLRYVTLRCCVCLALPCLALPGLALPCLVSALP